MEQYMSKTRADYRSCIAKPKIDDKDHFELKGQFLKELRDNTFNGLDHEDANEHIEKVLEIVDLFHVPNITQDQVMLRVFPMSLTKAVSHWLRNKLSAIQAQLNNLGREIKKVNEKVYSTQLGCEKCKGPHYTRDCTLKEEERTVKHPKGIAENVLVGIEARLIGKTLMLNRSLDPLYGDYIELNDLTVPLELRRDQVDDLMPTIKEGKWKIWMATETKTWEMSFLENHSARLQVWKQEDSLVLILFTGLSIRRVLVIGYGELTWKEIDNVCEVSII
nr:hypothetical protein [Tanacetum cinerariifolium]